jgi:hypothetical protein
LWNFAARWAIEDNPDGEVLTEVLEMVFGSGSNEA